MKRLIVIAAVVCLCATFRLLRPLAERLPAKSLAYVGWAGRNAAFDGSVCGQLAGDAAISRTVESLLKGATGNVPAKEGKQLGQAIKMLCLAWQHPMAVSLMDAGDIEKGQFSAAILLDLGKDREEFERQLKGVLPAEAAETTVGDVKVTTLAVEGNELAFGTLPKSDVFFAAYGKDAAKAVIETTAATSLASNKKFAGSVKPVGGENEQVVAYVDASPLIELAMAEAGKQAGDKPDEARKALEALGLAKVSAAAWAVRIVDRGMYTKARIFTPGPHRGLVLALAGSGTLTDGDLAFVPADTEFLWAGKVSLSDLMDEARRVAAAVAPEQTQNIDMALVAASGFLGFSIDKYLFKNLGDTWVIASAPSLGGTLTGTVVSVRVKDAEKIDTAMRKLENLATAAAEGRLPMKGRVEARSAKAGDVEIRYANCPGLPIPLAPAWAIDKDRLYISGWPQVVRAALEQPAKPITQDAAFAAARARLSGKPSRLSYINTPALLRHFYGLAMIGWTTAANALPMAIPSADAALDVDWLPSLAKLEKTLSPEISAVSFDDDGITFEGYGTLPVSGSVIPATSLMVSIALPSLNQARFQAKTTVSATNLNSIGKGIVMYRADHEDKSPAQLGALVSDGLIAPKTLTSPHSGRPVPKVADGMIDGEIDYVYLALPDDAPDDLILAYERPDFYGGKGTNVLLASCVVQFVDQQTFEKALAKTQAYLKKPKKNVKKQ